ncbi:MAG: SCP2 sterol-binding domain-containing protein [Candidatus Bathyarchaeia archaeon]|jgi:putative sterol carrier protein
MVHCSTIIKFLAWQVNRTPDVKNQIASWNRTVQFTLSGEDPFYVTFSDKRMSYSSGKATTADLEFVSESKDFLDVMMGRTRFDQGFPNGIFTIKGSITDAVRLMRVAERTFEAHSILNRVMRAALGVFG